MDKDIPALDFDDIRWHSFEKSGSIFSYLEYKGVGIADSKLSERDASEEIKDGEPIGYL